MKITRANLSSGYTQVPNCALRDRSLSFKARGLLAYLLTHVDEGWSGGDAEELAQHGPDGRSAILAAYKELVAAGYVVRKKRQAERGRWVTEIEVTDSPTALAAPEAGPPTSVRPTSENRTPVKPAATQVVPEAGPPTSDGPAFGEPTLGEPAAKNVEDQGEHQEELTSLAPLPATTKRASTAERGSRIPDNFTVDAEMVAWAQAETPDLDVRAETAQFVDYWRALPGPRARKLSWLLTWKNRMRDQQKRHDERKARMNGRSPSRGLVPMNGMLIRPDTVEHMERTQRMAERDARNTQPALGATA